MGRVVEINGRFFEIHEEFAAGNPTVDLLRNPPPFGQFSNFSQDQLFNLFQQEHPLPGDRRGPLISEVSAPQAPPPTVLPPAPPAPQTAPSVPEIPSRGEALTMALDRRLGSSQTALSGALAPSQPQGLLDIPGKNVGGAVTRRKSLTSLESDDDESSITLL